MSIWKDLRQRRVIQILLAYLAAGWLALGACDQLVDRAILPERVYHLLLVVYLAGIPAALVVGWFHGERGQQRVTRRELALVVLVGLAGLGAGTAVFQMRAVATPPRLLGSSLDLRRIAVLYFDDASRDGALRYLADGLTEGLIEQLAAVRSLDVISANGVRPFRESGLARDSIARELGTGVLIEGVVEESGPGVRADESSQIRVTTRLLDGESGALLERLTVELPLGEVLAVQDTIAEGVARTLRTWLGEEIRLRERRRETESPAAWALLQRAHGVLQRADAGADPFEAYARADSMLAQATVVDPDWVRPIVDRGWIEYRRSRAVHDPERAGTAIAGGLSQAERALALDPNHALALELRGTLRYWRYLLHLDPDPAERSALLHGARADLERSVNLDPTLARAHATLSHIHYQVGDVAGMAIAARRAYEEDAYLVEAHQVLWRLFLATHDLGQLQLAERWCDLGRERFHHDINFGLCRLYLLASPHLEPDVEEAWARVARLDSILEHPDHDPRWNLAHILAAAVLGRAGLPDSADHVLRRARLGPNSELDPNLELYAYEAFARTRSGDEDGAIDLLKRYVAANHGFRAGDAHHWWWNELRQHPRFREVETGG